MKVKTKDLKEYRRNYYLENREHLNNYQKWYSSYKKYLKNEILEAEIPIKPDKKKVISIREDNKVSKTEFTKGKFVLYFD